MISSELLLTNNYDEKIFNYANISAVRELNGDRLILSYNNKYDVQPSKLQKECNGLILNKHNSEIIAYPPPFISIFNQEELPKDIVSFVNITDGTSLLLYYYNNKWRISSQHAYDITNLYPIGIKTTYGEMFFSIITKFHLAYFNKDITYNFILAHEKIHPFLRSSFVVFVAAYNKQGIQQTVEFPSKAYFSINIENMTVTPITEEDTADFTDFCEVDLSENVYPQASSDINLNDEPIDFYKNCEEAYEAYVKMKSLINFGYILTRENGDRLLLESSLMKKIRIALYSKDIITEIKKNKFYTRNNVAIMFAITKNNTSFPNLFDQSSEIGNDYQKALINYKRLYETLIKQCSGVEFKTNKNYEEIAQNMTSSVEFKMLDSANANNYVSSFLNDIKMRPLLYKCLFPFD